MTERIVSTIHIKGSTINVDYEPMNICPICKCTISPTILTHKSYFVENELFFSVLNLCEACKNTFVSHHSIVYTGKSATYPIYDATLIYFAPEMFVPSVFEDLITNTFSSFVQIYNEAFQAEHYKLMEVAGIGYRKALEFLIKDFLILKNPNFKEEISEAPLMKCIKKYIDNPQLLTSCTRAVWLGNDQTHYIQKFDDKDITDLKKLIRLTVHWISMILETDEAEKIQPH